MDPKRYRDSPETGLRRKWSYGVWMRMNLIPAAILHTLLLFLKLLQDVIIKLADFGFAKIDRGDLVTPQFTPYYVSPQVKIK